MPGPSASAIEADISRIESGIRQLKIQYDMFLSGALPREPYELRQQVERLIKRYANAPFRKYQYRFHFNALVARFNSLSELWSKTLRSLEEGERPAPAVAERAVNRERTLAVCKVQRPRASQDALRRFHQKFIEARRLAGDKNGDVPYEVFVRKIASQAQHLRKTSGCGHVELRLVVSDRKVLLKARAGR